MPAEIRFRDPAFHSEVVLTGVGLALYNAAQPQFERLKGLKSLGLIAQIEDAGQHTRHQHLVGLMRIFNKLTQQPKDKGLPKSFLWSFWCRLCLAQTGHAAMSYDSEKAVVLACQIDAAVRDQLLKLVQPAIDSLVACTVCTKTCKAKSKGKPDALKWFDNLVDQNRWESLHYWIAAVKLLENGKLRSVLSQQVSSLDGQLGYTEPETMKMLLAPNCVWEGSMANLSRLDYIVRDLTYAGTFSIRLDVDNLVAAANAHHPDWKLLSNIGTYVVENHYENLSTQTSSMLFQRALAGMLIEKRVSLKQLFGLNLSDTLSDDDLVAVMKKRAGGQEVFDPSKRESWKAWKVNTFIDKKRKRIEVEKEVTGYATGHLTQHINQLATCFTLRQDHHLAVALSHQGTDRRPDAKAFVKLCRSILKKQYPRLIPSELTSTLFEGLVDRNCQHGLTKTLNKLAALPIDEKVLRKAAEIVHSQAKGSSAPIGELALKIGGFEYPVRGGDPRETSLNMMHAALMGGEEVRKSLGVGIEQARTLLWEELLNWQSIYFNQDVRVSVFESDRRRTGSAIEQTTRGCSRSISQES